MARAVRRLLALALLACSGCLVPAQGTPVFVDMRAGNFWSGKAMLQEVDEDAGRCRVIVRERTLVVRERWVDCRFVHARSVHDRSDARR